MIRRVFLAAAVLFGACYALILPPMQAPDEFAHWFREYNVSEGHCMAPVMTPIPTSVIQLTVAFPIDMRLWRRVNPSYLWRSIHQPLEPAKRIPVRNDAINAYHCLPYIPGALGIAAGRWFNQSPEVMLYLSRFANLITYIAIVFLALGQLPGFRIPMLCLALMPMTLGQAASASWDGLTFAVAFFLCAYILKLAWDPQVDLLTRRHYGILALTIVLAGLCKLDGWLVLLLPLIPASKFGSSRQKGIVVTGMFGLALAIMFGWNVVNRENIALWVEGIKQNRNILFSYNASFIIAHPWIFARSLIHELFSYTLLEQFIGRLGWLAVILPRWTVYLYAALLVAVALTSDVGSRLDFTRRSVALGAAVAGAGLIFVGIWCANTTQEDLVNILHGDPYIVGLQGRYFIPFAFPLLLGISGIRPWINRRWLAGIAGVAILTTNAVALQAVRTTYYRIGDTTKDYDQKAEEMNFRAFGPALPGPAPEISGNWVSDGYYKGAGGPGPVPDGGTAFGSYPDAKTGTIRIGPFFLDGQTELVIPVVTGPVTRDLSIVVREAVDKDVLAQLTPPPKREQWWGWHPLLPIGHPIAVEVLAEDKGSGWGQWLAIGWPHAQLPWGTEVPFSKLGPRLPQVPPEISGAWVPNGIFKGMHSPGAPPVEGAVFGSYPDANTGSIRLGPFDLDEHTRLAIPVVSGPDTHGLSAIVRDAVSKQILAVMDPPPRRETWWAWRPALPEGRKITVEIVAEDKGSGWGQWMALGWPHLTHE